MLVPINGGFWRIMAVFFGPFFSRQGIINFLRLFQIGSYRLPLQVNRTTKPYRLPPLYPTLGILEMTRDDQTLPEMTEI